MTIQFGQFTNLASIVTVAEMKNDKEKKVEYEYRMVILDNFPKLTLSFELGIPTKRKPKTNEIVESAYTDSSYSVLKFEPLLTVAFDSRFQPKVEFYPMASKALMAIWVNQIELADTNHFEGLMVAIDSWFNKLTSNKMKTQGFSSWNLVALRLLKLMELDNNQSSFDGDAMVAKVSGHKAIAKDIVMKEILLAAETLTKNSLPVDDSHAKLVTLINKQLKPAIVGYGFKVNGKILQAIAKSDALAISGFSKLPKDKTTVAEFVVDKKLAEIMLDTGEVYNDNGDLVKLSTLNPELHVFQN